MLLRQMTAVRRLLSFYSSEKSKETVCTLYISYQALNSFCAHIEFFLHIPDDQKAVFFQKEKWNSEAEFEGCIACFAE